MNNRRTGAIGEELAEIMLLEKGYSILARNFRCRHGEIDIIAAKGGAVVFVEVKTRLFESCGQGRESVTAAKRQRIRNCAMCYIAICGREFEAVDFQVIEINACHLKGLEF